MTVLESLRLELARLEEAAIRGLWPECIVCSGGEGRGIDPDIGDDCPICCGGANPGPATQALWARSEIARIEKGRAPSIALRGCSP